MKAFSLYKFWATVLVILFTNVLLSSRGWAQDEASSENAVKSCQDSEGRALGDEASTVSENTPCLSIYPTSGGDADTNKANKSKFISCQAIQNCIKSKKGKSDKSEAKCEKAVKAYKEAVTTFNTKCNKTGVSDCLATARDCDGRKTELAGSSTFSDVMKTSMELYGVSLANQRGLNPNQVSTAQGNCPQLSFKSYFDRKKELDDKIDKKTRDLEKAEKEAADKKQKDIPEAIEKANEKIKDLDDKLVKLREEISKEKDDSRKKKLEEDQKQAENEQAMLRKLLEVQKKAELDAANAATDSKLLREQLGLEPSAKDSDNYCMGRIQAEYKQIKAANGNKGFTAANKSQLMENFKKCQAAQELELKKKWASLNKANLKAQADQKSYDDQIRDLNDSIAKSKNFALTSKSNGDAALQSIETSAASKEQNLLTNRDKTAQTDNAKITALYESITASGDIMKKAANLKAEIYKAQQELQLLGPAPVDGYEKGSYTDVSTEYDTVAAAQKALEEVVGDKETTLCSEGKILLDKSFTSGFDSSGKRKARGSK